MSEVSELEEDSGKHTGPLEPGHPIATFMAEHNEILHFLEVLDDVVGGAKEELNSDALSTLAHVADHLVAAEKHHQREEDVLFPELERRGITGPPRIMRLEHDELRPRKKRLKVVVKNLGEIHSEPGATELRRELEELTRFITVTLRDHIFKENNILYPSALEAIKDESTWNEIKRRCDEIGYCCFTPSAG